jgi:DNA polymerase III subunit alpha
MIPFINLHTHTHYSLLDSLISPKELFQAVKELGQSAIAITDHGSLAAASEALKLSKETGIKLIMGIEAYFLDDVANKDERFRHLILLAQNAQGYHNLLSLNKSGYDNAAVFTKRVYPLIDWKILEEHKDGLICLTSCSNGILGQLLMNKKMEEAEKQLLRLKSIFGDNLGLEVQTNTLKRGSTHYNDSIEQVFVNAQLIRLGKKHDVRIVPTTNAHYVKKEDAETHDVMLAIGSHQPVYSNYRLRYDCPEFYLKTGEEVRAFFSRNYGEEFADQIIANTLYFADKCEAPVWIDPKFSNPSGKELPVFHCQDEPDYSEFLEWVKDQLAMEEDKQFLRFRCEKAFEKFIANIPAEKHSEYRERLEKELDVLYYCGVSSYMLIVADYVRWARDNGVPVGPGRGSCGGSFVAFLMDIHKADPIKYGLVFERFFSKLRQSYADIDLDFSQADRGRVIEYLAQKYGKDNVAQISNYVGITPKVYVRDIARSCELGGSRDVAVEIGNAVADCIPAEIKKIEEALTKLPLFEEYAKKYPALASYKAISGKPRQTSFHASGIVVSYRPLHHSVPVRKDKDGLLAIEYDMVKAEENGLVKMDILGLSTLDIIELTNRLIREQGKEVPIVDYEAYDQKTYDLISRGDTFGVFQFGTSAGTIDLCKRIKPKSIEDLATITTLARPQAKAIRSDFIKVRNGQKDVVLLHSSLANAFEKTLGYPLYDESLLILAKDVAGWDLGDADKLRKLTKEKGKNPEKVKKWREEFIEGGVKNGLHKLVAEKIWDEVVQNFGSYTFNKSHAVLYSFISYHTAYLKAHFPIEFLLANLMFEIKSNAPNAASNVEKIKHEIRGNKVKIIAPDLNISQLHYVVEGKKLITGLDALKFVGDEAIEDIISKRPFRDFQDFMSRVDTRKVRANTIQALAASGCLDLFQIPRHLLFLYCSDYRKKLQVWCKKHNPAKEEFQYPWPSANEEKPWSTDQIYAMESFYLGNAFSVKTEQAYGSFFEDCRLTIAQIRKSPDKSQFPTIKLVVRDIFEFKVKKAGKYQGMEMAKLTVEDLNGERCGLTIFPDRWKLVQDRVKELYGGKVKFHIGMAIHFSGATNLYEEDIGIILNDLYNVIPAPQRPKDLKSKKLNLKTIKREKREANSKDLDATQVLFEEIEDDFFQEGLLDLDEDDLAIG